MIRLSDSEKRLQSNRIPVRGTVSKTYENKCQLQQSYEGSCASNENAKVWNASRFCVSSLRRGHANLLCIVPILVYVGPKPLRKGNNFDAFIKRISRFSFLKTIYGA